MSTTARIVRPGASLTTAQTTAGGTAVAALTNGNVLLDASGNALSTGLPSGVTSPGAGALDFAAGTLTSSRPWANAAQTWNASGVTFAARRTNVTDTASASGSLLEDWQVSGVSQFAFAKNATAGNDASVWRLTIGSAASIGWASAWGAVTFRNATNTGDVNIRAASLQAVTHVTAGSYISIGTDIELATNAYRRSISLNSAGVIAWSSTSFASGVVDLALQRGGPNILDQRNGTAAQRKRVFNTGDATNGEWFDIDWQTTANVATIGARAAGTGTLRPVTAVGAWAFASPTVLTPSASVTLGTNGQFAVEITSNTAGNLVYRGSDGTTRRFAFTLS